jgi:hypothetical protein
VDITTLKAKLYEITAQYFQGANVVWGRTKKVKPRPALVILSTGPVNRPLQPIMEAIDGVPCGFYPSTVTWDVNLFTNGKPVPAGQAMTVPYDNTVVNDLLDFVNYINSPYVTDWCTNNDISIMDSGEIRDLTELINDTSWSYRGLVVFNVDFTQAAIGAAGILTEDGIWEPTASGGGSPELAAEATGYFESVEIKEGENT